VIFLWLCGTKGVDHHQYAGFHTEGVVSGTKRVPEDTVESRIIEKCAMSLELPSLVRSGVFLFFYDS